MKRIFLILTLFLTCHITDAQNITDLAKKAIDWGCIKDNNGPPDYVCASDEIAPGIQRGGRGPRACFDLAIAASKAGDDALALRWIATLSARTHLPEPTY